jgi:hypothetical protein
MTTKGKRGGQPAARALPEQTLKCRVEQLAKQVEQLTKQVEQLVDKMLPLAKGLARLSFMVYTLQGRTPAGGPKETH